MLFHVLRVRRPQLHKAWLEAMSGWWRRGIGPKVDLSEAAMAAPLTEFIAGCGCRLNLGQYQVRGRYHCGSTGVLYRCTGNDVMCLSQGLGCWGLGQILVADNADCIIISLIWGGGMHLLQWPAPFSRANCAIASRSVRAASCK